MSRREFPTILFSSKDWIPVRPVVLESIRNLYEAGRYLEAYRIAEAQGPLRNWQEPEARLLAGRLAQSLGSKRLSQYLVITAYRAAPSRLEHLLFYGFYSLEKWGPLMTWRLLDGVERWPAERGEGQVGMWADLIALRARCAAAFRDFATAHQLIEQALALGPGSAWICLEAANVYEMEDCLSEALDWAQHALVLRPWFRPAVQIMASLLKQLGRDEEGLSLLREACVHLQSGTLLMQLAGLLSEREELEGLEPLWAEAESLLPLADPVLRRWLVARRADALYRTGKSLEAAAMAARVENPYYTRLAATLEQDPPSEGKHRLRLSVPYVRQDHFTCGPATLASLCAFWGLPHSHDRIVDAICYNGTYNHTERAWVEKGGMYAREFRVTWEVLQALIERGVPFALATVDGTQGHLQAVVGFDCRAETLLIRDPGFAHFREEEAQPFLEQYAAFGPRGMVVLPEAERHRLDGLVLPEAEAFDLAYAFHCALDVPDRVEAVWCLRQLEGLPEGKRLVAHLRLSLAFFDGNEPAQLQQVRGLIEDYPENQRLRHLQIGLLRELGHRRERIELLARMTSQPGSHPLFLKDYALELEADDRTRWKAGRMLRRAHCLLPTDISILLEMGHRAWSRGNRSEAFEIYRFAACCGDKHEGAAQTYFSAARLLRLTDEALEFLRQRFARFQAKSSWPGRTLFTALDRVDRSEEAFGVLEAALQSCPEDADLMLFAADAYARFGRVAEAEALLERARPRCRESLLLRTEAKLANFRGDARQALQRWEKILRGEPLAMDAHREIIRLLEQLSGPQAAKEHLERTCRAFPHYHPLNHFRVSWLRTNAPAEADSVANALLAEDPLDAWLLRERALMALERHRLVEAESYAREALRFDGSAASSHGILGQILAAQNRVEDARAAYRHALEIDIDYVFAMHRLLELALTVEQARHELNGVKAQIQSQVIVGDALFAFAEVAFPVWSSEELRGELQIAWEVRPDLWSAWSVLALHLLRVGQGEEARALAGKATQRFPFVPGAWRDMATICTHLGDHRAAAEALEKVLAINPDWFIALSELTEAYLRLARPDEAVHLLEQARQRTPLQVGIHGHLAEIRWQRGEVDQAIELVKAALKIEPGYSFAWNALRHWCRQTSRSGEVLDLARQLTFTRPGEARSWIILADILAGRSSVEERLQALDRALAIHPRSIETYDTKAILLAEIGRVDEALEVCHPTAFGEQIPLELQGRAAWLEAQRGDVRGAIAAMTRIVEARSSYHWGWQQISEWALSLADFNLARRAAEALARLSPLDARPQGYLADVALRQGEKTVAIGHLRRALEIDPDYQFASTRLFELYLVRCEYAEIESLAGRLAHSDSAGLAALYRLRVALAQFDRKAVTARLSDLSRLPSKLVPDLSDFSASVSRQGARALHLLDRSLDKIAQKEETNAAVAALWIERLGNRRSTVPGRFLRRWLGRGDEGTLVVAAWIDDIPRRRWWQFDRWVRRHDAQLRANILLWGKIGYAFAAQSKFRQCVEWMHDWRDRHDSESWMLWNLVHCLRRLQQAATAREVSGWAIERGLQDLYLDTHRTEVALGLAMDGEAAAASRLLSLIQPGNLPSNERRLVYSLALNLVGITNAPPAERAKRWPLAFRAVRQEASSIFYPDSQLAKDYGATVRLMAQRAGQKLAFWQARYPGLPIPRGFSDATGIALYLTLAIALAVAGLISSFLR
jgi:tetratricopeptide (TPR) repeat protein